MTTELGPDDRAELAQRARRVIDANKYLTLATADATGLPWATPVYFTPEDYVTFRWVSSPQAMHSQNIAERPEIALAIYDSSVPVGGAQAVYARVAVDVVPEERLAAAAAQYSGRFDELSEYTPAHLRSPEPFRLYEARASRIWVLVRGGDPRYGRGMDSRLEVDLTLLQGPASDRSS